MIFDSSRREPSNDFIGWFQIGFGDDEQGSDPGIEGRCQGTIDEPE